MLAAGACATPLARAFAQSVTPACVIVPQIAKLEFPLRRIANSIERGHPIHIAAIGSSSTAGAMVDPAKNYPSQLQAELQKLLPDNKVTVDNHGVNGEVATQMLQRIRTDVMSQYYDLAIFQAGANTVLRDQELPPAEGAIKLGVRMLQEERGLDVILMNNQYAPRIFEKFGNKPMHDLIKRISEKRRAGLFNRFALMEHWKNAQGMAFDQFLLGDNLHMNAFGYECMAKNLAHAIVKAATHLETVSLKP